MTKKSEIFIKLQSAQPKYIGGNIKGLNGDKRNGNFTFKDSFGDVTQNTMTNILQCSEYQCPHYISIFCSDLLDPEEICI